MKTQRGVALLVVLMILAIMASLAANMTLNFRANLQQQSMVLQQTQLQWLARSAETLVLSQLQQALADTPKVTSLAQPVLQQAALETPSGYRLRYQLVDAQSCFNLNSLRGNVPPEPGQPEPYNTQVLRALLQQADVSSDQTDQFIDTLSDYLDDDDISRPAGAEDARYKALTPSRAAANQLMFSLNELASLPNLPQTALQSIRDQLCVLPEEGQLININTLTERHAPLLSALFLGSLDQEAARKLIAARPHNGWPAVEAFFESAQQANYTLEIAGDALKPLLAVRSDYFILHTQGQFEMQTNSMSSLIYYNSETGGLSVYQRRYRIID